MNDSAAAKPHPFVGGDIQRTLLVLAAWFFVAVWLGVTNRLVTPGGLPVGLGAAIVLPLMVFVLDARFGHPLFGGLMRLDLPALIGAQIFRVVGLLLLIAWIGGTLEHGHPTVRVGPPWKAPRREGVAVKEDPAHDTGVAMLAFAKPQEDRQPANIDAAQVGGGVDWSRNG